MTNKNTILVGIVALAIGILGTQLYYASTRDEDRKTVQNTNASMMNGGGMHRMPDGTMMMNHGGGNPSMDAMMMDMVGNMRGKSGKELEKIFLTDMIPHHQGAVDMAKLLLQDKNLDPKLAKFAQEIISAQEREIGQMREWLKSY